MSAHDARQLVLASGSRYRAELLQRIGIPFSAHSCDVDESDRPGEALDRLARRLAGDKAAAARSAWPDAWIIGSDQVAGCDGLRLGKPGDAATAAQQLRACSGREVTFWTAVCLQGPEGGPGLHVDRTRVRFRTLDSATIERYIAREPALDCAGSFKVEGLGVSLFDAVHSNDPTALVGLPLIGLCGLLRSAGFSIP